MKKKKKIKAGIILGGWLIGELVHYWLSLTGLVVKNYGISFGFRGDVFVFLNFIFIFLLIKIWWKNNFLGIGLVIIGGWVNLIDRLIFGYVRDYWQFGWVYNNLADWMIQLGVIIFLLEIWIKKLK